MPKPILIRVGPLTNAIYAVRGYTQKINGLIVSSTKEDVTQQAIDAVVAHARDCQNDNCLCDGLREAAKENYHLKENNAE